MQKSQKATDLVESESDAIGGEVLADSGFEEEDTQPDFSGVDEGSEG